MRYQILCSGVRIDCCQTVSALNSFLIVIADHPDIQRKAQTEIDSVVGNARPPTFSDRKHLPCLDTVLEEINRINPVGPPGAYHLDVPNEAGTIHMLRRTAPQSTAGGLL